MVSKCKSRKRSHTISKKRKSRKCSRTVSKKRKSSIPKYMLGYNEFLRKIRKGHFKKIRPESIPKDFKLDLQYNRKGRRTKDK